MSGGVPPSKNPITTHRQISRNPTKLDSLSNLPSSLFFLSQPRQQSTLSQRAAVPSRTRTRWRLGALSSGEGIDGCLPSPESGQLDFDSLLSVAEVLCVAPPAVYSIGCFVGFMLPGGPKLFHLPLGNRVVVWQLLLLAAAVAIGGLIRRRQWQRICRVNSVGSGVDLIGRIQKLEEDVRNSAMIVRVLSRQLEKLGIKFRVTRKTLKDPIAETAALAQKNSEATQILALQEDILEKELGEIQKVLLAMQEQQRKQLELILAIGKAGRLLESKHDAEQSPISRNNVFIREKKAAAESYSNQKQ